MSNTYSPHLLHDDYAKIGCAVVAFGYLEHELLRAAIGLQGGPDQVSRDDKELHKGFDSSLGGRLEYFRKQAEAAGKYTEWVEKLSEDCKEGIKWRNLICHGYWERLPDGELQATFLSRGSIKRGNPDIEKFTHNRLIEISKVTFNYAKKLTELHGK